MSKHTAGPWKFKRVNNMALKPGSSVNLLTDSESFNIGFLSCWKDDPATEAEATANARLIAAAPDLLEALELILATRIQEKGAWNWKPGESPLHDRCRSAIAKARGEA